MKNIDIIIKKYDFTFHTPTIFFNNLPVVKDLGTMSVNTVQSVKTLFG